MVIDGSSYVDGDDSRCLCIANGCARVNSHACDPFGKKRLSTKLQENISVRIIVNMKLVAYLVGPQPKANFEHFHPLVLSQHFIEIDKSIVVRVSQRCIILL